MKYTIPTALLALTVASSVSATTFKFAHTNSANHFVHKGAELFKANVEKMTEGKVQVELFPASQLGGNDQNTEQITFGSPMIGQVNPSSLAYYDNRFDVLSYPFLFKDVEQASKFLQSEKVAEWEQKPAENNIEVLCYFSFGARDLYTRNKKVESTKDSKGLKIRVQPLTMYTKMVEKSYNGVPTPMPWADVYNALQLGVIDAAEAPPSAMVDQKHFEVVKNYMKTNHIFDFSSIIVSKSTVDSMSAEHQKVFRDEAQKMCNWMTAESNRSYEKSLEIIKKNGVSVIDVNRDEFAKGASEIYKDIKNWDVNFYNDVKASL